MKKVKYSSHLIARIRIRKIPFNLPRKIYIEADEYYLDNQTLLFIALKKVEHKGKIRDFIVAFKETGKVVEIITSHPLKPYQKEARVRSGRWTKL